VAPASGFDRRDFDAGVAALRERGFSVRHRDDIFDRCRYLAGSDARRAGEIHEMFRDPEIHAIFGVRGGYGSARVVPLLDPGIVRAHPKIFVGMSDLTTLLLWFGGVCGLVAFHGPMVARRRGWSDFSWRALIEAVEGRDADRPLAPDGLTTVIGGVAEGPLVGGNLTILCHSIGTPWQADLRGAILFIEEVNDPYWRMDRRMVHLRAAGLLDGIVGVLVGQVHRSGETEGRGDVLREVLDDVLGELGVPVLMGFPAGHGEDNITLPMGVRARMDADRHEIRWLGSGVTPA
jgi:muramoyltetrapeptide carboxypeptidase